jgi:Lon protease-like protein
MGMTRNMLRIFLSAAAVFAVLTGAAHAQSVLTPRFSLGEDKRKLTPEEEEQKRQLDDAYKQATTKIPDQKAASDPWSDVRPTPPAPAVKKKQQ